MRPRLAGHLALLLAAPVLSSVIACGRPEQPPVEPSPPAIAEAVVTMATAGVVPQEAAAPKSTAPALPRRDLIRSTPSAVIAVFPLRGVDGEMVKIRPVTKRSIAWQLERLEPVMVRGETAYLRRGAWITSPRAIWSKYTTMKWDDEALALLVPSQEEGIWLELTITLASGRPVTRAGLIEAAESSPFLHLDG